MFLNKTRKEMLNATKIVSDAILGLDFRTVRVAGRQYQIDPPTIYRIAGVANCLANVEEARSVKDILTDARNVEALPRALSWFIRGDEELATDLGKGRPQELVDALEQAYSLIDINPFSRLSTLARNVGRTVAKRARQ